jgi:tetratricopeptide (TPR) repeat protein
LQRFPTLVRQRDDLSLELCALLHQTGRPEEARAILTRRTFQPWEGGEGLALGLYVRTHLTLGRQALAAGETARAVEFFEAALAPPDNLGEARHPLANDSDVRYWLGCGLAAGGDPAGAREQWTRAAACTGDFQQMSVRAFSEMTYFSILALQRLGRRTEARRLSRALQTHARRLRRTQATIEYFATSLPTMLLFEDDLDARQQTTALFLEAQALLGLGQRPAARRLLRRVLAREPHHALAADLLSAPGPNL